MLTSNSKLLNHYNNSNAKSLVPYQNLLVLNASLGLEYNYYQFQKWINDLNYQRQYQYSQLQARQNYGSGYRSNINIQQQSYAAQPSAFPIDNFYQQQYEDYASTYTRHQTEALWAFTRNHEVQMQQVATKPATNIYHNHPPGVTKETCKICCDARRYLLNVDNESSKSDWNGIRYPPSHRFAYNHSHVSNSIGKSQNWDIKQIWDEFDLNGTTTDFQGRRIISRPPSPDVVSTLPSKDLNISGIFDTGTSSEHLEKSEKNAENLDICGVLKCLTLDEVDDDGNTSEDSWNASPSSPLTLGGLPANGLIKLQNLNLTKLKQQISCASSSSSKHLSRNKVDDNWNTSPSSSSVPGESPANDLKNNKTLSSNSKRQQIAKQRWQMRNLPKSKEQTSRASSSSSKQFSRYRSNSTNNLNKRTPKTLKKKNATQTDMFSWRAPVVIDPSPASAYSAVFPSLKDSCTTPGNKQTLKRTELKYCGFCRHSNKSESVWTSHNLRDHLQRITCPRLRRYRCTICGATGDNAHTKQYCPNKNFPVLNTTC